jgi:hypothetical protein
MREDINIELFINFLNDLSPQTRPSPPSQTADNIDCHSTINSLKLFSNTVKSISAYLFILFQISVHQLSVFVMAELLMLGNELLVESLLWQFMQKSVRPIVTPAVLKVFYI